MNFMNYIENVLVHFQIHLKFNINLRLFKHVEQSQLYAITSSIVLQKNEGKSLKKHSFRKNNQTFFKLLL